MWDFKTGKLIHTLVKMGFTPYAIERQETIALVLDHETKSHKRTLQWLLFFWFGGYLLFGALFFTFFHYE
jgi:hypothetical protein